MHRWLRSCFALLLIIFVASCADSTTQTESQAEYNLTGQVTDADGAAVAGVTLRLSGARSDRTSSDAKGNFSFTKLPIGSYTVTPSLTDMTFSPTQKHFAVKTSGSSAVRFSAARRNTVPAATFSISGRVLNTSNEPIKDATVVLGGAEQATTMTDASGNYVFPNLLSGTYTISAADMDGYGFAQTSQTINLGQVSVTSINCIGFPRPIPPTTTPTLSISGTVTGAAADITGVTMTLTGTGIATQTTTTGTNGAYTFTGLSSGAYSIEPSKTGLVFTPVSMAVALINTSITQRDFTAAAASTTTPTYTLSGRVANSSGAALGGVTIDLTGAATASAVTASDGSYSFDGLTDGSYVVTPTRTGYTFAPASLSVAISGAARPNIDFTGTARTYRVSGSVIDNNGAALVGVEIAMSGAATASAITDASGNYAFTGLSAGSYKFTPALTGYLFTPADQTIAVTGANVDKIDFTGATPTFSLSGRVLLDIGAGLGGVTVALSGANTNSATTDINGGYRFSNLPNGTYSVTPSLTDYTFAPGSQNATLNNADDTVPNFLATPPAAPTFTISGRVLNDLIPAAPIVGATVTLTGAAAMTTTTNATGGYLFAGLADGSYAVKVAYADYTLEPATLPVTVRGADVPSQDFVGTAPVAPPPATYSISGRVADNNGAALSGVLITLSGAASKTFTTDATGTYAFAGLTTGSYSVTPTLSGYTWDNASRSVALNGADVPNQNFVGTPPPPATYTISGRIVDDLAAALSGVTVTLGSGATSVVTTTNTTGNFSFAGRANGAYTLTPTLTGYTFAQTMRNVTVNGADVPNQNFVGTPVPAPTYSVSGQITLNGTTTGVSGVTVTLSGTPGKSATTGTTGAYTITGVTDGAYTLTASLTGYTFTPTPLNITVAGANLTARNFSATPPAAPTYSVSGQITLSGTTTGVSNVTVALSGAAGLSATTSATGNYTISGVTDGSYTLTPSLTGYTFTPATLSITVAGANLTARNFSATPPAAPTFSISGRIADKNAVAASGVTVTLSGGGVTKSAVTDGNGDYSFTGMSNGTFTLIPSLTGYLFSPATLDVTVSGANAIAAGIVATPPAPGTRNYTLFITAGTLTISGGGGAAIPSWSFTDAAGTPMFPGPTLTANEGDTVNITVTNNHTVNHNLVIAGVTTDATPILPGTTKMYTFVASKAGTYLYSDTLNNNINRSMGLYGALIVGPASGGNTAWTGGPSYTFARTWITSDLDKPRWNDVAGTGGTVNTGNYKPNYFVINGMGGRAAMEDRVGTAIDGTVGQIALVRIVNAGQYRQSFHFHANHVKIISINGARQTEPYKLADVVTVPPMQTMELIFVLNQPGTYPMHNHTAQMETANGTYGNGVLTMIYIR